MLIKLAAARSRVPQKTPMNSTLISKLFYCFSGVRITPNLFQHQRKDPKARKAVKRLEICDDSHLILQHFTRLLEFPSTPEARGQWLWINFSAKTVPNPRKNFSVFHKFVGINRLKVLNRIDDHDDRGGKSYLLIMRCRGNSQSPSAMIKRCHTDTNPITISLAMATDWVRRLNENFNFL